MQQHNSKPKGREYSLLHYPQALWENWTRPCCSSGPPLQPCPGFRVAYQGESVHPGSAAGHPGDSRRVPGSAVFWSPLIPQGAPALPSSEPHLQAKRYAEVTLPAEGHHRRSLLSASCPAGYKRSGRSNAHFWSSVRILKVRFVKAISTAEQGIVWIFCSWAHIQLNISLIRSEYLSLYSFM